ncbi:MFS transporter [Microbacterium indicum]|uniref:MFS transporter n=1 Tax=Microbacterium indicum TaxID=358100 RepID=UPI0004125832|nr:MFS transporter [Microbacterium indicum]
MTSPDPKLTTDPVVEPTPTQIFRQKVHPPKAFILYIAFAIIGAGAAQMSLALLTLTLKATELDAEGATTIISLSSAIAGIFTLIALPAVGTMSDRSRSAFGRRRPYLVAGAVSFVAGGLLLIVAPNIPVLVAAHLLVTLGFVCANIAVTALVTDQLPAERRGPVVAVISMGTAVGGLLGTAVSIPFGDNLWANVGIPTVIAVAGMLLLAARVRDPKWEFPSAPFSIRSVVGVFWVNPLAHPNFTWIFTSRMLVFSAVGALNAFQAVFLMQRLGIEPAHLGTMITLTVLVTAGVTMIVTPYIGRLSDRLGVRKPFVVVAAFVLALGLVFASRTESFGMYLVACGVVGLGQGVYFAVELALGTLVLPDPDNPAGAIGILKIADNLPTTIVAAVAPAILAIGGGQNFSALFIAGAISAVVGGLVITLIRGPK